MYYWSIEHNGATIDLFNSRKWQLLSVNGLNPPSSSINTATVIGVPGVRKTGSKIEPRSLEFSIYINTPCEQNRAELLAFLASNLEIRCHLKTGLKDVYIDGTIESNEYEVYTNEQIMQVSVLCEYPYFKNANERVTNNVSESTGGFEFPMDVELADGYIFDQLSVTDHLVIYNYGQIQTGLQLSIELIANVSNPKIYNVDDESQYIGFTGDFLAGDRIFIDTNLAAKSKATLTRGGVTTKILNRLMSGITWLKVDDLLVVAFDGSSISSFKAFISIVNHDELAGV